MFSCVSILTIFEDPKVVYYEVEGKKHAKIGQQKFINTTIL
jgi:hypothetical protein